MASEIIGSFGDEIANKAYEFISNAVMLRDDNERFEYLAHEICKISDVHTLRCISALVINFLATKMISDSSMKYAILRIINEAMEGDEKSCSEKESNLIEFPPTK